MYTSYKNHIFGVVCACLPATSALALTCTHNEGHRSALFSFDETSASLEILLGDAVVATAVFQCGLTACTYSQDLGERGGPLHHVLQYFEERSEVIYAVSHEDFPARSAIQIYPVVCKAP